MPKGVSSLLVTLAKRICALLPLDDAGKPARRFEKGGLVADFVESIAAFLERDAADEIWLHLKNTGHKGPSALYSPLSVLERRVFVPIVAWAPVPSPADARLLLGFGADRVVVDANLGGKDPVAHVARIVHAIGHDRLTAAIHVRRLASEKGMVWELVSPHGEGTGIDAITLAHRLSSVGVSEILLVHRVPAPSADVVVHDGELVEQVAAVSSIPVLSLGQDRDTADLATPLLMGADGVCTALFASGTPTPLEAKIALAEYGIALNARKKNAADKS